MISQLSIMSHANGFDSLISVISKMLFLEIDCLVVPEALRRVNHKVNNLNNNFHELINSTGLYLFHDSQEPSDTRDFYLGVIIGLVFLYQRSCSHDGGEAPFDRILCLLNDEEFCKEQKKNCFFRGSNLEAFFVRTEEVFSNNIFLEKTYKSFFADDIPLRSGTLFVFELLMRLEDMGALSRENTRVLLN